MSKNIVKIEKKILLNYYLKIPYNPMTPTEKTPNNDKVKMSQYNAAFNANYDVILLQLVDHFYQNGTIESDSKYGLANYSILRTLFDYVDEVIPDFQYTPEQLLQLIDEHDKLRTKFEQKLLAIAGETEGKIEKVIANIESE
jgi:hypothetical protein